MPTLEKAPVSRKAAPASQSRPDCYHCGQPCLTHSIRIAEKAFCCEGCKLVYEILSDKGLCNYYDLQKHPGLSGIRPLRKEKFAFLDSPEIAERLYSFTDGDHTIVTFYLPGVHCSSCMWLLEHLPRLHDGVLESRLSFSAKEVTIHFSRSKTSLRTLAELLTTIGYEPYISLSDGDEKKAKKPNRTRLYRLGIAGFAFSFIMMMSLPEYFGGVTFDERYSTLLRGLCLLLGIPVFFYCAGEFFTNAWKGIRPYFQKGGKGFLNIDAPIALSVFITFSRSVYEILSGTGGGYLDSMSGIVFFMLVGRLVQERTYSSLSFHRDYQSYFPIAVTVLAEDGTTATRSLPDLREGDHVQLHNDEIIPADGLLTGGAARIDYSFVTGESEPVKVAVGEKVYAGGRQTEGVITLELQKRVAGSYLTSLWNNSAFARDKVAEGRAEDSVHRLSKYFTITLFSLAAVTAIYWAMTDPSRILNAITAMLIVACPCALLLAATFTNGNLLRLFSKGGLFLRDASVIEKLSKIDTLAFDKTGTLTIGTEVEVLNEEVLSEADRAAIYSVVRGSQHPLSRALAKATAISGNLPLSEWKETVAQGVEGVVDGKKVLVGNAHFTGATPKAEAQVYARVGEKTVAFSVTPQFRTGLPGMMGQLRKRFKVLLLSGDQPRQQKPLQTLLGETSELLFNQKPEEKLQKIESLQAAGHQVLMLGDGLNDAGALQQSNVGITLAEDINNFTPACDAILDARQLPKLPQLLSLARWGRFVIRLAFAFSILYNVVGLSIAMQGLMHPMIAAILMPSSTLTIVLLSTGICQLVYTVLFRQKVVANSQQTKT